MEENFERLNVVSEIVTQSYCSSESNQIMDRINNQNNVTNKIGSSSVPVHDSLNSAEIEARISSSNSSGMSMICRICYEGTKREQLISPCKCMGTMGYLHRSCIERWLGSSNSNKCEICHFEYITVRQPKPLKEWLCRPSSRTDRRNLCGDVACFVLLTPLAAISAWLCASGAKAYAHNYDSAKLEAIGLLILAIFLVVIYLIWVGVAARYHYGVYRGWSEHNQFVRVVGLDQLSDVEQPISPREVHSDMTAERRPEPQLPQPAPHVHIMSFSEELNLD